MRITTVCAILLCLATCHATAAEPTVIDVWPGAAPGDPADLPPESVAPAKSPADNTQRVTNVSHPTLTIYRPAKDIDTGAAIIIAPGGGYNILAFNKEGTEVAEWLNTLGITGIVLKYRVPRRPGDAPDQPPVGPLQDAQRALSLVRSQAPELGLDPHKIGFLGFSAGGNLAARVTTNYDRRAYDKIDSVDEVSCRPDFSLLIYPAYIAPKDSEAMHPDIRVTADTPPCFFVHTDDDGHSSESSVRMYVALKRAGVPAELHIYSTGGHGYGLRPSENAVSTWPDRAKDWLKASGVLIK